jgi:undecaprenyl-diphosphatase
MTDSLVAVVLGVVEGMTEFLPVSSTGHLLIAEHFIPRQSDLFNVVIQAGAVLAVIPLFHQRFHQFLFRWRDPAVRDYLLKIIVACVITGGPGYLLKKKGFALPEHLLPVALALLIGGALFIIVEGWLAKRGREPAPLSLGVLRWRSGSGNWTPPSFREVPVREPPSFFR